MRISDSAIRSVAREIGEHFNPEKVILFGSYAYGQPTKDSDVDYLVIMNSKKRNIEQAVEISCGVSHPFPMDIIVLKPRDVSRRLKGGDVVLQHWLRRGVPLYETVHA